MEHSGLCLQSKFITHTEIIIPPDSPRRVIQTELIADESPVIRGDENVQMYQLRNTFF